MTTWNVFVWKTRNERVYGELAPLQVRPQPPLRAIEASGCSGANSPLTNERIPLYMRWTNEKIHFSQECSNTVTYILCVYTTGSIEWDFIPCNDGNPVCHKFCVAWKCADDVSRCPRNDRLFGSNSIPDPTSSFCIYIGPIWCGYVRVAVKRKRWWLLGFQRRTKRDDSIFMYLVDEISSLIKLNIAFYCNNLG